MEGLPSNAVEWPEQQEPHDAAPINAALLSQGGGLPPWLTEAWEQQVERAQVLSGASKRRRTHEGSLKGPDQEHIQVPAEGKRCALT
jgi:hypothetical protein